MDKAPRSFQNLDNSNTDILKKRLLNSQLPPVVCLPTQANAQQNTQITNLRQSVANSMLVPVVQTQNSIAINHNIFSQSIAPLKIQANNQAYPLQLHLSGNPATISTVNVPVQIPGSTSNINVPVQLTGTTSTMPLHIPRQTLSVPIQAGPTTSVPVQLPAGTTINVPLQLPNTTHSIQLNPAVPIIQTSSQTFNNPIYVQMGPTEPQAGVQVNQPQIQMQEVTINNMVTSATTLSASNSSVQCTNVSTSIPQTPSTQVKKPQVVYIQTPTGLKSVNSSEIINTASTTGNPPHIVVRRPATTTSGLYVSNVAPKTNIAPKATIVTKSSLLNSGTNSQPIVIQKPKPNVIPVTIVSNSTKPTYTYCVKKPVTTKPSDTSILIPNSQTNSNTTPANQKLFITPMNLNSKTSNTKLILPMSSSMSNKGPLINFQISNGQLQNDAHGNITVMRENAPKAADMPVLEEFENTKNGIKEKTYTASIAGSRVEQTGEQEYTLSIPETNSSLNDDIYTVSINDDPNDTAKTKSFTLSIPDKGKSLINSSGTIAAPAILRRSNSENIENKNYHYNIKRRISLSNDCVLNKQIKLECNEKLPEKNQEQDDLNDDHRVPSLFCDEKLDKDLEFKLNLPGEKNDEVKVTIEHSRSSRKNSLCCDNVSVKQENEVERRDSASSSKYSKDFQSVDYTSEEDSPGLIWNDGLGQIKGSDIQFQTNEFGLIDVVDTSDIEDNYVLNPSAKYHTPLKQRLDRDREKKPTSPEDLYRCDGCGCHGMAAEFVTPNFCSHTCQTDYKKAKKASEVKKRNKIKKLILQQQSKDNHSNVNLNDREPDKDPAKLYDFTSAENSSSMFDQIVFKNSEDAEVEKYPWMCGKNGFSWMKYLEHCKAKAAPVKLFKDPFPYNKNGFKVGMKMEAIDPIHPATFAVVSVAEIQGYRMRLHFDGFHESYDFWVNADSPDIFPAGWREKCGGRLQPPRGIEENAFSWSLYLKQCKCISAPKHLFTHLNAPAAKPSGFRIGMKLEAEDRKNNLLVCVATIADIMDTRLLITFDSWDDIYDYWVDPCSPYIHPIGWAEENGYSLTLPDYYKDPETFSWRKYLSETGASAVPARAFRPRPPIWFKVGMKLEVVDKRVPFLIRVATISDVKEHRIRISFDGWPDELSYWLDDDSPDIHPVGWCLKTGHPLEPPLTAEELRIVGPCGTAGCRGLGSTAGGGHKTHTSGLLCPYAAPPVSPPDRLTGPQPPQRATPLIKEPKRVLPAQRGRPPKYANSTPTSEIQKERSINATPNPRGRPPKYKRVDTLSKSSDQAWDDDWSVESATNCKRTRDDCWLDISTESILNDGDPIIWSIGKVRSVVAALVGPAIARNFAAHSISGSELLMMSRRDFTDGLGLKLGPSVKLYAAVLYLRKRVLRYYKRTRYRKGE